MEGPKPHVFGIIQQLTGGEFRLREEQVKGEYRHLQGVRCRADQWTGFSQLSQLATVADLAPFEEWYSAFFLAACLAM